MDRPDGPRSTASGRDVNIMATSGQTFGDSLHVHRPSERAGHHLVEGDVKDAHGQEVRVFLRHAKKGPDGTRPKRMTSSIMSVDTPTSNR